MRISLLAFLWIAAPALSFGQTASQQPLTPIDQQDLAKRAARIEAALEDHSKSLKVIEGRLETAQGWRTPTSMIALGAVVVSFAAALFAAVQFFLNLRETRALAREQRLASERSELMDSLKWFGGGIQNRAIGLAIVNGNWHIHKRLRPTWTSVLLSQAVYIISKPDKRLPSHELENLRNALGLLQAVESQDVPRLLQGSIPEILKEAFNKAEADSPREHDGKPISQRDRKDFLEQLGTVKAEMKRLLGETTVERRDGTGATDR